MTFSEICNVVDGASDGVFLTIAIIGMVLVAGHSLYEFLKKRARKERRGEI